LRSLLTHCILQLQLLQFRYKFDVTPILPSGVGICNFEMKIQKERGFLTIPAFPFRGKYGRADDAKRGKVNE
jgi:hypothetical protein